MKKFTNARIYRQHDDASEILVDKGAIKAIGKNLPKADEEIDLKGRLVVPPYVDAHLHLDYVYTPRSAGATKPRPELRDRARSLQSDEVAGGRRSSSPGAATSGRATGPRRRGPRGGAYPEERSLRRCSSRRNDRARRVTPPP